MPLTRLFAKLTQKLKIKLHPGGTRNPIAQLKHTKEHLTDLKNPNLLRIM